MQGGEHPRHGSVDRSQVRHVVQHELDTANRLARLGFNVVFRPPKGESTADAYVNGLWADFKTTSSNALGNIKSQVRRKRRKQGPRFVLDITPSRLAIDDVVAAMRQLYDEHPDTEIASILVIDQPDKSGPVLMRLIGEEVPEWQP